AGTAEVGLGHRSDLRLSAEGGHQKPSSYAAQRSPLTPRGIFTIAPPLPHGRTARNQWFRAVRSLGAPGANPRRGSGGRRRREPESGRRAAVSEGRAGLPLASRPAMIGTSGLAPMRLLEGRPPRAARALALAGLGSPPSRLRAPRS